jgi:pimeloyl-ACP methyl ester carboxylesterase
MPYLSANGITQYYELTGRGLPIVFVHGAFVDHRMWESQAQAFSPAHQVIRHDLRGHGQTGGSAEPRYSIELFAQDLRALIDLLEIDHPVLCGLSLGGMIAQAYAASFPVAGLVLVDTLASARLSWRDSLMRKVVYPRWLLSTAARVLPADWFARFAVTASRIAEGQRFLGSQASTRDYVRSCMERMTNRELTKTIEAIYRFRLQPLSGVSAPALVLSGEHEAGIVKRHSLEISRQIAHATRAEIPGAGHLSNLDNPVAFNARLRAFLEAV